MITVDLKGRLGNQMFIYAFARGLLDMFPDQTIGLVKSQHYYETDEPVLLENYKLNERIKLIDAKNSFRKKVGGALYSLGYRFTTSKTLPRYDKRYNRFIGKLTGRLFLQDGYEDYYKKCVGKNTRCNGYFQSEKFFPQDIAALKAELQPNKPCLPENEEIMNRIIADDKAVCVDIRLGDYIDHCVLGVCTKDYYLTAMKLMAEKLGNPRFYIFSNDIEQLKEVLPKEYDIVFESGIPQDYEKLRIMSKCKHYIMSNSSYSWWAQYLCENEDKIVIAPNKWFKIEKPCDIFQKDWILLEV